MTNWFNIGKIVNTHGLKGELRVLSTTDFPEQRFVKGNKIFAFADSKEQPHEFVIQSVRKHKNFYLLTLVGLEDINLVEKYKGMVLRIPKEQLQTLPDHEYYYHEIIGCQVVTDLGEEIGTITDIYTPGANDVWAIKRANGKEVLIPYIADVVVDIQIAAKKITIHPMEGLFE